MAVYQKNQGNCTDDNDLVHKNVKIGDEVTFVKSDGNKLTNTLKKSTYKVVGFVSSPAYIQKSERGSSTVGKGKQMPLV